MKSWSGERLETFVENETTIEHLHRYAVACDLCHGKTVIDIASGEGYGANLLSKVAKNVIGVDIDQATINNAKIKYTAPNLSFQVGSAEKIPIENNTADIVVSFETIEHLDNHDEMLLEIKRILKPDGMLIISTPDKKKYADETGYRNPYHKKELTKLEFQSLLSKYFATVAIYLQFSGEVFKIAPENKKTPKLFEGSFTNIKQINKVSHKFLIALSSNNEINEVEESDFNSSNMFFNTGVQYTLKSHTYKLGNFILWPFKQVKALFKKKK